MHQVVLAVRAGAGLAVVAEQPLHTSLNAQHKAQALCELQRTLLIPLLARVWGHRWRLDAAQPDESAERVLGQLHEQCTAWMPDPLTMGLILWRTQQLVVEAKSHFAQHPNAWGLNLGAGLSDYFQWLDNGRNRWVDADLSDVIELRARCLPVQPRAKGLALDVCQDRWWSRVAACVKSRRQPMFIMLEGLLLYLQPAQAQQVLATLGEYAPDGSCLVFDVIPRWLVGCPVRLPAPAASSASSTQAPVFRWGIASVNELEALHPRLHVQRVASAPMPVAGWSGWTSREWQPWSPYAVVCMSVS